MTKRDETVTVAVENLGGIASSQVRLADGVSVLTGRNATNRTSLLRAIGAALGGSSGALKADADEGSVTLSVDGAQYTRTFERDGDRVRVGGDPYTDEATLVDQYACLLADNPARRAVERGDAAALRSFIMAPVDTDALEARIGRTRRTIESLREELSAAKRQREWKPELQRRLADLREELAEVRESLDATSESVAAFEADVEDAQAAEEVVDDLKETRETYERVRNRLETQRDALDSLRAERDEVQAELDSLTLPDVDRSQLEAEIERLQRRARELETTVTNLLSIVEFNEQLTDEAALPTVGGNEDTTEALDPSAGTVECWTCGTTVERAAIDERLDDLRDVIDEKRTERNELRSTVESRRAELDEVREAADERQALEAEVSDIEAEIADREATVQQLERRTEELRTQIDELEAAAEASDELRDSDLLAQYQRRSELEYERGQLEEQIESVEGELQSVREAESRIDDIELRLDEREAELEAARTRVEELERSAVETFNEHMETVLTLLGYENIERVWIERTRPSEDGDSEFVLHVVRATDEEVVYEDTVRHLSESEREVIGLVVALAGYLVHDVHETVPVMVLDSLEAIDADRIAALVEYFAGFVPHLVVALLPEDAAALPSEYERIQMGQAPA
jgi:septal ring factor EnvC (AmiA/AmiB activator)